MRKIYLDYASGALENSANPSAIHSLGVQSKQKLENARAKVAEILHALPDEVVFTSGATESNNLAILGLVRNFSKPHIITTNIEHASVLETLRHLEKNKIAEVSFVPVEKNGILNPKKITKMFRSNTILVSVMYANNEIGTIQPIREIAKIIRRFNKTHSKKTRPNDRSVGRVYFHTDATQAVNYLSMNVLKLGVDLLSLNSGKIYGPRGVGALYVKRDVPISSIMFGGSQERELRPGTENEILAQALADALTMTERLKEKETKRLGKLRNYFFEKLKKVIPNILINGDLENRLPNNVNVTIPKVPSDLLVLELSARGIMVSAQSACQAGDGKDSHVIAALRSADGSLVEAGSLRFSLGRKTTQSDIDYTVKSLAQILRKLLIWYN